MTMLPISADELVPISTADFLALRSRLYEHDIAMARAEERARAEAAELARLKALAEVERLRREILAAAERARIEAEAAAAKQRTADLVAQFHVVPVRGDCTASAKQILKEVAAAHGFAVAVVTGGRRHRAVILARQEAMYRIAVECPHMSYPEIGRRIGGRDHSTVRHGAIQHAKRHGLPLPERSASWVRT